MVNALTKFSISQQSSTFEGKKNISSSIIDSNSLTKEVMQNLFEEFQVQVKHFQHQQNIEIKNLVIERKIKNSDMYKDEHPKKVYQALYFEKDCYPALPWLFKFAMLIPPNWVHQMLNKGFHYLHCY